MRRNKLMGLGLAAIMALTATACGAKTGDSEISEETKTEEAFEEEEGKLVIGMSLNEEIDFVTELQSTLEEKAEEAGNVEIIFTNANGDAEKQLSDVDSLITQNPDVIVMRAVDADAGVACVEAVKAAGIYCIVQDTPVNTEEYDCRIIGDQSMVGQLIGSYMQEWLDEEEDRTIHMGYINGGSSETLKKRETGIYDAVDPERIQTFSSQIAAGFSAEDAMSYAEDWLQSQPDMNCIACANDEMAAACIQALSAAGVDFDHFLVFGCDGGAIGQQYLQSGELDATAYQSVSKIADSILEVSRELMDGTVYEDKQYNPQAFVLMTKDNIEEILSEK